MPPSPLTETRLQQARDQERLRIGALLHDELGGQLLGMKLAVARITMQLAQTPQPDPDWLRAQMATLAELAATCMESSACISSDLSPPYLQAGLSAALETLCQQFGWQSGIRCEYAGPARNPALNGEQTHALYLICREALNNVGKHAQASHVKIQLTVDETGVDLKISDNGRGIALACGNDLAQSNTGNMAPDHGGNNVPERSGNNVPGSSGNILPEHNSNNAAERGYGQGLPGMAARAQAIGASLQQTVPPGQPGCCWEVHLNKLMT